MILKIFIQCLDLWAILESQPPFVILWVVPRCHSRVVNTAHKHCAIQWVMRHTRISEISPLTNKECFIIPRRVLTMLFAMHSIFHPGIFSRNQVLIFAILISLRLKICKWSNTSYVSLYLTISFRIMIFWRQIAIFDLDYLVSFVRFSTPVDR